MNVRGLLLSVLPLALTLPAAAASLSVNGTCQVGTCSASDVISVGQSASSPFSFQYTLANTDRYQATGIISASFPAGYNQITAANVSLVYLGNSTGSASGQDTLVLDFLQYFADGVSTSGQSGFEYVSGNFQGAYSNASSVQAQGFSARGTAMQLLGPFSAPNSFMASAINQPFATAAVTPLDFRDTVVFGAGSGVGATINVNNVPDTTVSPVPEPSSLALLATGMIGVFAAAGRRFRAFERRYRTSECSIIQ